MTANKEYLLQLAVTNYLDVQYPEVMYRSDLGGVRLSLSIAKQMKAIQKCRGFPDLFICASRRGAHGLFLELKQEGTKLYKRNGEWASEHVEEQYKVIRKLQEEGYAAYFAIGFDEAKFLIDEYLEG